MRMPVPLACRRRRGYGCRPMSAEPRTIFLFGGCFLISLLGLSLAEYALLNHDMAGILLYAEQAMKGKQLYTELFTVQVPFIIAMMMIPISIHQLTGIGVPWAFHLFVFVLLQLCVLLSWRFACRGDPAASAGKRYAILSVFYFMLFLLPFNVRQYHSMFGQREVLFMGLVLPYVMLCLLRLQGRDGATGTGERLVAGLLAAAGFCIKPHFVLILAVSELFLMLHLRSFSAWKRTETLVAATVVIAIYALTLALAPEYFQALPREIKNYRGHQAEIYSLLYYSLLAAAVPFAVVFAARRRSHGGILLYLFFLFVASCIIFMVQCSGYTYQFIPALAFTLLLLVLDLLERGKGAAALLGIPLFMLYMSLLTAFPDPQGYARRRAEVLATAQALAPYRTVAALTGDMWAEFPAVTYSGKDFILCMPYLVYVAGAYIRRLYAVEGYDG